jgi:hypothetical protein
MLIHRYMFLVLGVTFIVTVKYVTAASGGHAH